MSALDTKEDTLVEKRSKLARQLASLNKKAQQLKSAYQSIADEKKSVRLQIQDLAREEAELQKRKKELQRTVKEVSDRQKSFVQKKQLLHLQQTQVVQAIAKVDHTIKTEKEAEKKRQQEQEAKRKQQEQEAKRKQQEQEATRKQQEAQLAPADQTNADELDFDLDTFLTEEPVPAIPQAAEKQDPGPPSESPESDFSLDFSGLEEETEEIEEIEIDLEDEEEQIDVDLSGLTEDEQLIEFDIDIEAEENSNRGASRTAINVDVNLHTESNFFTGLTENLSEGGLFIATYDLLEVGTQVDLVINLPNQHPIKTQCIVCWTRELNILNSDQCPGMGLQFRDLAENQKQQIREFLELRDPLLFDDA